MIHLIYFFILIYKIMIHRMFTEIYKCMLEEYKLNSSYYRNARINQITECASFIFVHSPTWYFESERIIYHILLWINLTVWTIPYLWKNLITQLLWFCNNLIRELSTYSLKKEILGEIVIYNCKFIIGFLALLMRNEKLTRFGKNCDWCLSNEKLSTKI